MKKKIILPVVLLCLIATGNAVAEKWYFEPVVSLRLSFDDNVRLSPTNEEEDFSTLLVVDSHFGVRTEVSDIKFQVRLDAQRYQDLDDLNTNDIKLGMQSTYQMELNRFGLDLIYESDDSRNTEVGSTGLVQTNSQRELISFSPNWQRQLSERALVFANYNYSDIEYDGIGRVNYWADSASIGFRYALSEKTSLQTSMNASRYEAESISSEYQTYGLRAGFTHQFTETFSSGLTVGLTHTESDYLVGMNPASASDNSWQLDASLKKQFQVMDVSATFSITEAPGSQGRLLRNEALKLSFNRKLSERLAFSVAGTVYRNESAGGIVNTADSRTYYSLEPRLRWKATRWWTVIGSYRYRNQEYTETGNGSAESNALFITAQYTWPREIVSRWME